jgi:UDP-N-acetylmuramate dehydrogenase
VSNSARRAEFVAALRAGADGQVREAEPLARYSTYRIGGPATVFLPANAEAVARALRIAAEAEVECLALGLGSNVLLPDAGVDALVIRLGKGLDGVSADRERWRFGAGLPAPLAARKTAEAGWGGLHMMVGVPGTVGGGVFMNAGCHGGQWSDVIETVLAVDRQGESRVFNHSEIPFRYRQSGLAGWVVLETTVKLVPASKEALLEEVTKLFEWRQRGTPFNQPCCGSVFKNPEWPLGTAPGDRRTAGQLIEAAGLKGARSGGVEVSPMHANYFVNTGGASAADVRALVDRVRAEVHRRFGVTLEPEVRVIGVDGRVERGGGKEPA